ncbi:unnamed protein product [Rhizopus stolonifer]
MSSETWGAILGYASIFCWIVVFTPQLWQNFRSKNADGVSVTFLLLWIVGDIFNLIGIVLDNLLFTMLLLAVYYLCADCLLMGQVLYYQRPHIREETIRDVAQDEYSLLIPKPSSNEKTRTATRFFFLTSVILWVTLLGASAVFFQQSSLDSSRIHVLPQLFGWASAILYCSSRIPQIMQNFKNQSVEGLSLFMFVFSVVGNITFCLVSGFSNFCFSPWFLTSP